MNKTHKYLVFLDIDGVFTSSRVHKACNSSYEMWSKFDPVAIDFMNKIHDRYPVRFVIMSTWKNNVDVNSVIMKHWVYSAFSSAGFRGQLADPWKTDPEESCINRKNFDRAHEVKEYLDTYGNDVDDYILFDDNRHRFAEILGKKRLVLTDPLNGLLYKHMLNAKSIMGTWHEK